MLQNILSFVLPFLIPIGLFVFGSTIESVIKKGQIFDFPLKEMVSFNGVKLVLLHYCEFMHHFYLACFAFDLACVVAIIQLLNGTGEGISFHHKEPSITLLFLLVAFIFHLLAYTHTMLILNKYEKREEDHPITNLHFFYLPLSVALLFAIRW